MNLFLAAKMINKLIICGNKHHCVEILYFFMVLLIWMYYYLNIAFFYLLSPNWFEQWI